MKNKDYFVYLISSNNLHNEMIQNYLKSYNITCITKKDYFDKKELLSSTDIIILLGESLISNQSFINILQWLICQKRKINFFKTSNLDNIDFFNFLKLPSNIPRFNSEEDSLFKILLSLNSYFFTNIDIFNIKDKSLSQDIYFIRFLDYYLNYNIRNEVQMRMLLPISLSEYHTYLDYVKNLNIDKMNEKQIQKYLPLCYKKINNKKIKQVGINMLIDKLTLNKDKIEELLKDTTYEELNEEFKQTYEALRINKFIDNHFVKVLILINAVRITKNEMYSAVSMKNIKEIKNYIILPKTLQNKIKFKDNVKVYYLYDYNTKDKRIEEIKNINNKFNLNETKYMNDANVVIAFVTKDINKNEQFLNILKDALYQNIKLFVIYLDRCIFELEIIQLIKYNEEMYYWAYNRMDLFYERYLIKLERIINSSTNRSFYNLISELK